MDRIGILMCGHPNPLGCPNHGDAAREIWAAERDAFLYGSSYWFAFGSWETEPIPFELTRKGYQALRDAGINPPPIRH